MPSCGCAPGAARCSGGIAGVDAVTVPFTLSGRGRQRKRESLRARPPELSRGWRISRRSSGPSVHGKQLSPLPALVAALDNPVRSVVATRRTVLKQDREIIGIAEIVLHQRAAPRRSGFLQRAEQIQQPPTGVGDSGPAPAGKSRSALALRRSGPRSCRLHKSPDVDRRRAGTGLKHHGHPLSPNYIGNKRRPGCRNRKCEPGQRHATPDGQR